MSQLSEKDHQMLKKLIEAKKGCGVYKEDLENLISLGAVRIRSFFVSGGPIEEPVVTEYGKQLYWEKKEKTPKRTFTQLLGSLFSKSSISA